jgi:hypothetical protein
VQHDDGSPDQPDHLGGVFVAGVITYNKWQGTRRARPWSAPFLRPTMTLMSPDEPAAEPVFAATARAAQGPRPTARGAERAEPPCPERKPVPAPVKATRTRPSSNRVNPSWASRRSAAAPAADEAVLGEAVAQAPQSTVAQVIAGAEEQGDAVPPSPAARNAGRLAPARAAGR